MNRRELLALIGSAAAATGMGLPEFARAAPAASRLSTAASVDGETLYNGIRLPAPGPPRLTEPLDELIWPPGSE
jgi:hypothetical protein